MDMKTKQIQRKADFGFFEANQSRYANQGGKANLGVKEIFKPFDLNSGERLCFFFCISRKLLSSLRQSHPNLPLVLTAAVFVRHLTNIVLVAFKKQHLGATFTCINFGRQRCGVGEFQRYVAFPFRLKRRHVNYDAAACVSAFTQADGKKIISYGTSSYGYDIRCAPEFKVFTNIHSTVVDPKNFDEKSFVDFSGDSCIIPPNSFALARTLEYFRIPRNVLTICLGKSTYARCGIIVNVTPFEPEWEGYVTLEFSNTTPLPAKIYAGEGCAQVLFFESDKDDVCEVSYKDRGGKYQGQVGVTLPKA